VLWRKLEERERERGNKLLTEMNENKCEAKVAK